MTIRILFSLLLIFQINIYASGQSLSSATNWEFVPSGSWQGYSNKVVPKELALLGINSNPAYSDQPELIRQLCESCDPKDVSGVFLQLLEDKNKTQAGIFIIEFASESLMEAYLSGLSSAGDDIFLSQDNILIQIVNFEEDDQDRNELLRDARQFYEKKGAKIREVAIRELIISEQEFQELLADAQDQKQEEINTRADAQLVHLLELGEGFMVFYDDGTMRVCAMCSHTQEVLDFLAKEPADAVYLQSEKGLTIFQQIQSEGDAIFIDFEMEDGTWHFRNGKRLISNSFL